MNREICSESVAVGELQKGRDAVKRHAWQEAFDILNTVDQTAPLCPEDLESLAEAAWWLGLLVKCINARERAFRIYIDTDRDQRAGYMAISLARDYFSKRESTVAGAWLSRAERLLREDIDSPEKAWLMRTKAVIAIEVEHDFGKGLDLAGRAMEIAARVRNRDVMTLALHDQGRALIATGKYKEGMVLVDEATVAGVGGKLGPWATGAIFCNTITTCQRVVDIRRAGEWTEAAKRWCEREAIAGFPGMCRVYRAEIMRFRGAWREAEEEARRASEELKEFNIGYCAEAFYQIGEIRLHVGDLSGAEEAFFRAHELGRNPQPGLALLRMAEGKTSAALKSIQNALASENRDRLFRVKLLPAMVEIAIAGKEWDAAFSGLQELEEIARDFGTPALSAIALSCRAVWHLARSEQVDALRALHECLSVWKDLDAPFEIARTRLWMAEAYLEVGDLDNAALELKSGKPVFERLDAKTKLVRAAKLQAMMENGNRIEIGERSMRALVFTDLVKSTALIEAIGDAAWIDLVRWHDQTVRTLVSCYGGEEVDHSGDGFFIAFRDASSALYFAAGIQKNLCGTSFQARLRTPDPHRRIQQRRLS